MGRKRTGPASFKGRRSRTRGRSQCVLVKIWRRTFTGTLQCALKNGAYLYVNERQKMRHYRARSAEERRRRRRKNVKSRFFTSRGAYVLHALYSDLYTHSIANQP